jgi:hypothetical protein
MKKTIVALVLLATTPVRAESLTVEQCISILTGLNSLNCSGQQLGGQCDKDAKPYKLGEARYAIAINISALGPVESSYRKAVQGFTSELEAMPPAPTDKPDPFAPERAKQNKKFVAFQVNLLAGACGANLTHLKLSDLKLGDGPDQNAIPPSVLAAFAPIIDK